MSIIEETLRNLQAKQETPPIDDDGFGDPGLGPNGFNDGKPRRYRFLIWFTILMALLGAGTYFGLVQYQNSLKSKVGKFDFSQDFLQTPLTPPSETPPVPEPAHEPALATEAETPVSEEIKVEKQESEAAPSESIAPTEPEIEIPGREEAAQAETPSIETISPLSPKAGDESKRASFEEEAWIKEGWRAMNENRMAAALAIWEKGFRSLPGKRIVLVLRVYDDLNSAKDLVQKLGETYAGFIARGRLDGKKSYYVLSAPPEETIWEERDNIVKLMPTSFLKGNFQEKILSRMQEDSGKVSETWIKKGWRAMGENRMDAALSIWETGFLSLPKKRIVLVINVYDDSDSAINLLQKLGEGYAGFIARGKNAGKDSYYVLSAPSGELLEEVRAKIVKALPINFLKGNFQEILLARMLEEGKAHDQPMEKLPEAVTEKSPEKKSEEAKIEKKPDETLKPLKEAKEKIITPKPQPELEKQLNRVKNMLNGGAYEMAIETLKPIMSTRPEAWETFLLMGTAYLGLGELDLAASYLDQGLALDGRQPQLWGQRAIVEQQNNAHEAALGMLREAERLSPGMPGIKLNMGYSHDALGHLKEAETAYRDFLYLTEGDSVYLEVRRSVQKRLLELSSALKN